MSEESGPLKELKIQLEAINKEINKATITIKEALKSSKMMLSKPFVSLEIPNKLFSSLEQLAQFARPKSKHRARTCDKFDGSCE